MKVKICMTWDDDYEDSIVIEADTLEDLQQQAAAVVEKRKPDNYWSEQIT